MEKEEARERRSPQTKINIQIVVLVRRHTPGERAANAQVPLRSVSRSDNRAGLEAMREGDNRRAPQATEEA